MTKARDLANIITGGFTSSDIPNLAASQITSGTFADARLPATALNSNVDLTTLNADHLTSGTVADARIPNLNASKITAGTIATARLGSGTASSSTFLRGDGSFNAPPAGKVLQYKKVQAGAFDSSSGFWNVSSASLTSTNGTMSITPTSSSSVIIGQGFISYGCDVSSVTHLQFGFNIQRISDNVDVTAFSTGASVAWDSEYNNSQQTRYDVYRLLPAHIYDSSHGTTSEITYRLFVRSRGSQHQNRGGGIWMHLWEVDE